MSQKPPSGCRLPRASRSPPRGTQTADLPGYRPAVPYPPRLQLQPLSRVAGTASPRPDPAVQGRVEASIVEKYAAGRSLPELAELTDRSFSAVRNILARHGVHRRGAGARLCCVNRVPDD
jgi:hypothetical protein